MLAINLERLRQDVEELATIGRTPSRGVSRPVFSEAHERARAWLLDRMAKAGLAGRVDSAGNTIGRLGGSGPCVMAGSHIDSVPDGGPLDGALGVLAALECTRTIQASGVSLRSPIEVTAFADEEGRFLGFLGSKAMVGQLRPDEVARAKDPTGFSLVEAMRKAGFDPDRAHEAARDTREVMAYVELHIEQGPVLDTIGIPIGIVQVIVGIKRLEVRFLGQADHAGTTPMDVRKDSFLGAAEYALKARDTLLKKGTPLTRNTFGIVEVKPKVANIVPSETMLLHEIRDVSPEVLGRLAKGARSLAKRVAKRRGLGAAVEEVFSHEPVALSQKVQEIIASVCRELDLPAHPMPSGAGHDAQIMAGATDAGMIFIPSHGGRSHRPDEWSDWPAIERGGNVLLHTLLKLAG